MAIDPSIPLAVRPPQFANPLETWNALTQIQMQRAATQAQIEDRRAMAEERERKIADQQAVDRAATGTSNVDQIVQNLKSTGYAHLEATVRKQYGDADKAAQEAKEKRAAADSAEADYFGTLASGVKSWASRGPDAMMNAAQMALQHAKDNGHDVSQVAGMLQRNPQALPQILDSLIQASPKQRELLKGETEAATGAQRLALEAPKLTAEGQIAQAVAANTVGGLTPAQQSEAAARVATQRVEQGRLNEDVRYHNLMVEASNLSPQAVDKSAEMFATTGQLPQLGMGQAAARMRSAIINRATQLYPSVQFATSKAAYQANSDSLKNITKTLDTLSAFENTAGKNLDQFLALASKVPDTGVPWINRPIRAAAKDIGGSENQAAFEAARDVALREIARVTNDPKLSGVLSDSARQEVQGLSPTTATFAQIKRVATVLKQDMANVHSSLSDQQKAIQDRIAPPATSAASSAAPAASPAPAAPAPAAQPGTPKIGERRIINGRMGEWDGHGWKAVG
jgi:hypothetical protein